jgi:hypothetical protein
MTHLLVLIMKTKQSTKDSAAGWFVDCRTPPGGVTGSADGWPRGARPPIFGILEITDREPDALVYLVGPRLDHHEQTGQESYLGIIHPKQQIKQRYRLDFAAADAGILAALKSGFASTTWDAVKAAVTDDWENETYCTKTVKPNTTNEVERAICQRLGEFNRLLFVPNATEGKRYTDAWTVALREKGFSEEQIPVEIAARFPKVTVADTAAKQAAEIRKVDIDAAMTADTAGLFALLVAKDAAHAAAVAAAKEAKST